MAGMAISSALEEKLKNAESLDEVVQACAEEGIAITKEQLEAFLPADSEAELTDEALDNVSGGVSIARWFRKYLMDAFAEYFARKYGSGGGGGR